jgi:hypothetical protein
MYSSIGGLVGSLVNRLRGIGHKAQAAGHGVLLVPVLLGGCSIHPLQQDVTGVPTVDIVHHIRCETRFAIQDKALDLLRGYRNSNDPRVRRLTDYLASQRGQAWRVNRNELPDDDQRKFYDRYTQTGIAYDFTLDITEENRATLFADPVRLITHGAVGIGVNAVGDFNRNNARRFIMSDTFDKLLRDELLECRDQYPNFAYPIAGSIGIGELISTFIDLNEDKNLQVLQSGNSRVFADTLTFTTTLTGSVTPHVEIAPVGNLFGLAPPTSVQAFGQRLDKHMVIIGLSMDTPKVSVVRQAAGVPLPAGIAQPRSALQKSGVTSAAEQSALDAARQARIDAYLDRATR